jgi:DNA polymerase-1
MIYFIGNKELVENEFYEFSTIDKCIDYFKDKESIEVDTETTGFDPHTCKIICIQLGDKENQFVIDVNAVSILLLKELLESKLILFQNAKFDLRFLYSNDIYPTKIYDTFLAECVLTTGLEDRELGLKALAWKYCGVLLDKEIRGQIYREGLSTRVIQYAANDVAYLHLIREKQLVEIEKLELNAVLDLENEVVKVFAKMEFHGILLDPDKWMDVAKTTESNVINLQLELDEIVLNEPKLSKYVPKYKQTDLFGFEKRDLDINWSSNAQKLKIVKDLGINIDSVDERNLSKNKRKHIIMSKLLDYSKQAKLVTSFGKKFLSFINPKTQRIHFSIWQILSTGRISVSEPNLNQIPSKGELGKKIRSCFIPKEGYSIVGGDFSGMELRLIAEFSQDKLWLDAFNAGQDLHSVLCAKTFDISITDVKQETPFKAGVTYRDVQKTINFGLAYGMSKFKLADTIDISVDQADKIIKKFFDVVPQVNSFLNLLGNTGKKNGQIRTARPFRRLRQFGNWQSAMENKGSSDSFKALGEIERASKNSPIQGSNGDIIKLALINVQNRIDANNYPVTIILAVYDEIQTECRDDFAEEWKLILNDIMIESAKVIIKSIPVEVDCKISKSWTK